MLSPVRAAHAATPGTRCTRSGREPRPDRMPEAQVALVSERAAAVHGFRTSEWISIAPPVRSYDADETVERHRADNPTPPPASLSQRRSFAVPGTEESSPHFKEDDRASFTAASQASKAADYLRSFSEILREEAP